MPTIETTNKMLREGDLVHQRYQLEQKLGDNRSRQTWLVKDINSNFQQRYILKLLAFGGEIQWQDLKLFEREAQILKDLNHPRIPKYRDYFSIDDRNLWFVLVQEYIGGASLKDLLERGKKFSLAEIERIATEVLEILTHLHQLSPPVIHRDIKPSNLMWGEDERIYLVDFGAVQDKAIAEGVSFTVVGTYGYTPIEQFGGRTVPASDLYALGATLIHLLTGVSPADLPQRQMRLQFRELVTIDSYLVKWLEVMISPSVEERFQTAAEAMKVLKDKALPQNIHSQETLDKNTSGCGWLNRSVPIPHEIRGWNWGAFLVPSLWCIGNQVWIGLLCWLPSLFWGTFFALRFFFPDINYLFFSSAYGILSFLFSATFAIAFGLKGNQWAWQCRDWRSVRQFRKYQKTWSIAGCFLVFPLNSWLINAIFAVLSSIF
jgi:serine/threonine protein kinase